MNLEARVQQSAGHAKEEDGRVDGTGHAPQPSSTASWMPTSIMTGAQRSVIQKGYNMVCSRWHHVCSTWYIVHGIQR